MRYSVFLGAFALAIFSSPAMALCTSYPNTLTNGTTADGGQVMANFNCAALTSGATLNGATFTGTTTLPGTTNVTDLSTVVTLTSTNNAGWDAIGYVSKNSDGSANDWIAGPNITANNTYQIAHGTTGSPSVLFNIISSGNVGIGTAAPSYTLHVNGSVAGTSAYVNLSDERLKKNVRPITNALATVLRLQGVTFDWREPGERAIGKSLNLAVGEPQVGFVAQNLRKILPQAVSVAADGKDAIMSVAESKVIPVLVEALKEMKASNDNQLALINDLRVRVSVLERSARVRTAQK